MKTLGLIGGMSWESTSIYYKHLNEIARERLGGLHSAKLLLWSVDFAEIAKLQHENDWPGAAKLLVEAAERLENAGAEALVICTNTMHKLAPDVENSVGIPLIHIADATARDVKRLESKRPLLLATRFTMEEDFYRNWMKDRHGIDVLVPEAAGRDLVHRIIYEELCRGQVLSASKKTYLEEIERARQLGADGVILGCTEITMLLGPDDTDLPVFDSTRLHAEMAMAFALDPEAVSI
jgi:aspartate racemase